jgi:hypothetical protein
MNKPIFFCHIPKTAGTSLRFALEEQFHPAEVVPDASMIDMNGGHYSPINVVMNVAENRANSLRLLRGHYSFSLNEILPESISIVVLREPKERCISHLKHLISAGVISEKECLDSLDRGIVPIPDNVQTRYMGGGLDLENVGNIVAEHHKLMTAPILDESLMLDRAVNNIHNVDILGLTQGMEKLVMDIEVMTGLNLNVQSRNVGKSSGPKFNEEQINTIVSANKLDYELYNEALNI